MNVFVGTSGWIYPWNPDGFEWYLENSGLNAVELNMSFYRFPFRNQINGWAKKMEKRNIRWSVKVNRLITHYYKFGNRAFERWKSFRELFSPLEEFIDFYLFQIPPRMGIKYKERIERFFDRVGIYGKIAFEPRNPEWYEMDLEGWGEDIRIIVVSVDSPELPKDILCCDGTIYLRMHGRTSWYSHWYSEEELREVVEKILEKSPERVYVFFNNNHAMLENARETMRILGIA